MVLIGQAVPPGIRTVRPFTTNPHLANNRSFRCILLAYVPEAVRDQLDISAS